MGAVVKAIAITRPVMNLIRKGALALESKAASDCMAKVGLDPKKVGILINTGIYRDDHIIEPAIATLVQRNMGCNQLFDKNHSTFSFDLDNGACGVVTAMQLIDGYIRSGTTEFGMILAGDSNPRPGLEKGYDYDAAGGAVLLAPGKEGKGFGTFKTDTYLQHLDDFTAKIKFMSGPGGGKKTHYLIIEQSKDYLKKCVDCSTKSFKGFLTEASLKAKDVDLVITSQSPKGFIDGFRKATDLGKKVVDVTKEYGNIHTVGPLAALETVLEDGRFAHAKNIVLLGVGSGITVSMAHYRN
jgi:3-oxoacyl-[acyl-carrier-protein] synthase-3